MLFDQLECQIERGLAEILRSQRARFGRRKVVMKRNSFAEEDVGSTKLVALVYVKLAFDVPKAQMAWIVAHHHVRDVSDLKKALVVDRDREHVHIFSFLLHGRQIGLQQPLDADVCDCWVVELATADAQVILEHEQEPVLVENLADHSLVHVACLQRLVSSPRGDDVANLFENSVDELGSRKILSVADREWDLNLVDE